MKAFSAYVFDAYGTLFDVHSATARHRDEIGPMADHLSELWRTKQLEYTWTRTLMGAHRSFRDLTAEALDFVAARCGGITMEARTKLLAAYDTLDAYPDVKPTLTKLKAAGARVAILSNGTPGMLEQAIVSAGLEQTIDACFSVEEVGAFKTAPAVYNLVGRRWGFSPSEVSFQSSNRWDIAGAVKFGFRSVWINRTRQPDEYSDLAPELTLYGLAELVVGQS